MTMLSHRPSCSRLRFGQPAVPFGCAQILLFVPALDPLEGRASLSPLVVTDNHDSGPGSLRQAILDAHSGDTVHICASARPGYHSDQRRADGQQAPHHRRPRCRPAGGERRRFEPGLRDQERLATVTISGLTITHGQAVDGGGTSTLCALTFRDQRRPPIGRPPRPPERRKAAASALGRRRPHHQPDSTSSDNQSVGGSSTSGSGGYGAGRRHLFSHPQIL